MDLQRRAPQQQQRNIENCTLCGGRLALQTFMLAKSPSPDWTALEFYSKNSRKVSPSFPEQQAVHKAGFQILGKTKHCLPLKQAGGQLLLLSQWSFRQEFQPGGAFISSGLCRLSLLRGWL
eukprot:1136526-Pelagomonas_calceolata.AAC.7